MRENIKNSWRNSFWLQFSMDSDKCEKKEKERSRPQFEELKSTVGLCNVRGLQTRAVSQIGHIEDSNVG